MIKKYQGGFTLIEALVTLVIFSIGLLGISALQINSLQGNRNAYNYSRAVWAAYDMADRIRTNSDQADSGYKGKTVGGLASKPNCASTTAGCAAADLVDLDVYEWNQAVISLPSGTGSITEAVAGELYNVDVMWVDPAASADTEGCDAADDADPADTNDLQCFRLKVRL